jgi:hypothetical protein
MQDHRAGLHRSSRSPFLPRRAKQHEPGIAAVDIHGHGPASRRADDHLGLMLVELLLGDLDGLDEILVGQLRIDDLMAVLGKEGRFDAAWDRLPPSSRTHSNTIWASGK